MHQPKDIPSPHALIDLKKILASGEPLKCSINLSLFSAFESPVIVIVEGSFPGLQLFLFADNLSKSFRGRMYGLKTSSFSPADSHRPGKLRKKLHFCSLSQPTVPALHLSSHHHLRSLSPFAGYFSEKHFSRGCIYRALPTEFFRTRSAPFFFLSFFFNKFL